MNQLWIIDSSILSVEMLTSAGRARDLRSAITHIRFSGRLADLIYSMERTHSGFNVFSTKEAIFVDGDKIDKIVGLKHSHIPPKGNRESIFYDNNSF